MGVPKGVKSLDYLEACALDLADQVTESGPRTIQLSLQGAIEHHFQVVREEMGPKPDSAQVHPHLSVHEARQLLMYVDAMKNHAAPSAAAERAIEKVEEAARATLGIPYLETRQLYGG